MKNVATCKACYGSNLFIHTCVHAATLQKFWSGVCHIEKTGKH